MTDLTNPPSDPDLSSSAVIPDEPSSAAALIDEDEVVVEEEIDVDEVAEAEAEVEGSEADAAPSRSLPPQLPPNASRMSHAPPLPPHASHAPPGLKTAVSIPPHAPPAATSSARSLEEKVIIADDQMDIADTADVTSADSSAESSKDSSNEEAAPIATPEPASASSDMSRGTSSGRPNPLRPSQMPPPHPAHEAREARRPTIPPEEVSTTKLVDEVEVPGAAQTELRDEVAAASGDTARESRLLAEIGEAEERRGNEAIAARDYLDAFNSRPDFREPLEALLRVLERRRSLKNLLKLSEALVKAAITPDEKARALVARATQLHDQLALDTTETTGATGSEGAEGDEDNGAATSAQEQLAEARASLVEATESGAGTTELGSAWLMLEVLASVLGETDLREKALVARAENALGSRASEGSIDRTTATWRALLQIDAAELSAANAVADNDEAKRLQAAKTLETTLENEKSVSFAAAVALERVARSSSEGGSTLGDDPDKIAFARLYAKALEEQAARIHRAITNSGDRAASDAEGVPRWARTPTLMVDAWLRAADTYRALNDEAKAAALLDRGLEVIASTGVDPAQPLEPALVQAHMRIADALGDASRAADLAERRLHHEKDGGLAAALAVRVAMQALGEPARDVTRAKDAIRRALESDPTSIPARAIDLELAARAADGTGDANGAPAAAEAYATELEALAERFGDEAAKARLFICAAYVHAAQGKNAAKATADLEKAKALGTPAEAVARMTRTFAALADDDARYEVATRALADLVIATPSVDATHERETSSLLVELFRAELSHPATGPDAQADADRVSALLREIATAPGSAWLGRVLEAFHPKASGTRRRLALQELAENASDPDLVRGFAIVGAVRAQAEGDTAGAIRELAALQSTDPSDPLTTTYLADLQRLHTPGENAEGASDAKAGALEAATTMSTAAAKIEDAELATSLYLDAAFARWRAGDRAGAIEALEEAAHATGAGGEGARVALAWASRGVDVDTIDGRRSAIRRSLEAGGDVRPMLLEQFASELALGDHDGAIDALQRLENEAHGDLALAAALARLTWPGGQKDIEAVGAAIAKIGAAGGEAALVAAAEQVRFAREVEPEALVGAAERWFHEGGGLTAAFEWIAGAMMVRDVDGEVKARAAMAGALGSPGSNASALTMAEELLAAGATMTAAALHPERLHPFVDGGTPAARLINLELSPAGCDPSRRSAALLDLEGALGDDADVDARMLAGWSELASGDAAAALETFARAAHARPEDYATWEGLRAAAEELGDAPRLAFALEQLGARTSEAELGAALWEDAATVWQNAGDMTRAEAALDASFARDAARATAFDRLFRRVRDRADKTERDRLLALIDRRLDAADDPTEIAKLFWEQARAYREAGDTERALKALENVTMLEPDHVGALALTGEIALRRGLFGDAADSLARLSSLKIAPAKNRITAGVTAVDLYENKLDRHDLALKILNALHAEGLTTLPVRERLARTAARNEAWDDATAILEELMFERPEAEGRIEAARLAMAIHRDRRKQPLDAERAMTKLLEEKRGDAEALDLLFGTEFPPSRRAPLLEAAKTALLAQVQKDTPAIPLVHRLATAAKLLGDAAFTRAAVSTEMALDHTAETIATHIEAVRHATAKAPKSVLTPAQIAQIAASGDDGPLAQLFAILGPTLAEALGPSLSVLGVTKKEKVDPRSGLPLRNTLAAWFGALGIGEFDLYVGGNKVDEVVGIPGEVPAIVVGSKVTEARGFAPEIAREVFSIARGTSILRWRDDTTVAAVVIASCRIAETRVDAPPNAMQTDVDKQLGKAIARKTKKLLPDVTRAIVAAAQKSGSSVDADARAWSGRALMSQLRMYQLASGDLYLTASQLHAGRTSGLKAQMTTQPELVELLRFGLSPTFLQLRAALGLETAR